MSLFALARAFLLSRDCRQQEVRCVFDYKAPVAAEASVGKGESHLLTQIQFRISLKSLYKCCPLQSHFAASWRKTKIPICSFESTGSCFFPSTYLFLYGKSRHVNISHICCYIKKGCKLLNRSDWVGNAHYPPAPIRCSSSG